jgi:HK97 family phage major capsid protein
MKINHRKLQQMVAAIPANIERKEAPDLEVQIKAIKSEILGAIGQDKTKLIEMQRQLDALDVKLSQRVTATFEGKTLKSVLEENDAVSQILRDKKGSCVITIPNMLLERKTTLTAGGQGFMTTGVLAIDRTSGITPEARQELHVRDALSSRPTTFGLVDFVKVTTPMSIASPVAEASTKPENQVVFTAASEKVKTIATTLPASRQILDDFTELLGFLQTSLTYYVDLAEELQILSGDGTGENLHGLIPQAGAFNTALLGSSWNRIDIVGRAIQQIAAAKEFVPTFVVLHVNDWWSLRLTKDSYGRYLLGSPMQEVPPNIFGLTVIPTVSIANGTFLMGSGRPEASEIRDRLETIVEISTSHQDFFVKNLLMLRAERREALVVKRPLSYLTGSFSQSPA